jgi:uncharacterized protein (DUF2225 family)/CRP-like cAMP-binding protein
LINLSVLKNITRVKKYMQGSAIPCNSSGDALYIVLTGEAEVYLNYRKQNQELIAKYGPGDFFGEAPLFLGKNAHVTVLAATDVFALPLNKYNALAFMKDEPEMAFELMKALCERSENVKAAYEKLAGRPWAESLPATKKPSAEGRSKTASAKPAPTAAAKPASAQVAPVQRAPLPADFSLFPEGHGKYQLPMGSNDRDHLFEKKMTCPICKKTFAALRVKSSNLVLEKTDSDMRSRYTGVEPLYYDVITCPHCLYSALTDSFDHPDKPGAPLPEELKALQGTGLMFGTAMDTDSVFAGYYLALICAPVYFSKHGFATAKLLLKLSRVYQDCGDKQMEDTTAKRALDAYMYVYLNIEVPPAQDQQLCLIIGELYLKQNDLKNARDYFFKAKINRSGTPHLHRQAEDRIDYIRTLEGKA